MFTPFKETIDHGLRHQNIFTGLLFNSVYDNSDRVSFLETEIYKIIPENIKHLKSLYSLKNGNHMIAHVGYEKHT